MSPLRYVLSKFHMSIILLLSLLGGISGGISRGIIWSIIFIGGGGGGTFAYLGF